MVPFAETMDVEATTRYCFSRALDTPSPISYIYRCLVRQVFLLHYDTTQSQEHSLIFTQ